MGFRIHLHNLPVQEDLLNDIRTKFKDLKIKEAFKIRADRNIYMLVLENNKKLRLDIYPRFNERYYNIYNYQKILYENGINVPKPIKFIKFKVKKNIEVAWKLSEWIDGIRVFYLWRFIETFEKIGEQVAKINSIKDPVSGMNFCLFDFSSLNGIWTTKGEIYIIDLSIKPYENVSYSVYKTLTTCLRTESRINAFLEGYSKIRSTKKIVSYAEKEQWKWKERELKQNIQLESIKSLTSDQPVSKMAKELIFKIAKQLRKK